MERLLVTALGFWNYTTRMCLLDTPRCPRLNRESNGYLSMSTFCWQLLRTGLEALIIVIASTGSFSISNLIGKIKGEHTSYMGNLAKAESSLVVQIRTEKIGFAQFLASAARSSCHSQTAKHIIRYCILRPHRRRMLEEAGTTDYKKIVSTSKGLRAVTAWLMKLSLLPTFCAGYRTAVSRIKAFFTGTGHANGWIEVVEQATEPQRRTGDWHRARFFPLYIVL